MDERLGEMQITLNNLYRRIADMEQRIRDLEAKAIDTDKAIVGCMNCGTPDTTFADTKPIPPEESDALTWTGSIQGLDGEWTVTPPPEFDHGPFSDEEWSQMVSDACQNPTPRRST